TKKAMRRNNLRKRRAPGTILFFNIKWWYKINNRLKDGGRSGYEYFEDEDNYLYTIAQFYPRMAVYNEVEGWQHKQFLGAGEFTLTFGNFDVRITVPADHVVGATGELQNARTVLTDAQRKRMEEARMNTKDPVFIVTEAEARDTEAKRSKEKKTWVYKAENVRDFAFATSRKFIWDAMAVKFGDRTVMAMSLYPKEGNPLWEKYSTRVVAHTLKTYSKYTFDYPYPLAYSIHTDRIGMEYPMICFNGGRPEADGTYSERTKFGMIGVIVHEVGHNFFPMIVNSDERQWTWMDEGLNSFLEYITEQEWDADFPTSGGQPVKIVDYMKLDKSRQNPIMTNSESVISLGPNAYTKPATGLYILRETIMGRELFDMAFKEYAQRWKFKHPTPADFFRTMEDASAVDLDWFWRGWFFSTDNVDIAMDKVEWFKANTQNPEVENAITRANQDQAPKYVGDQRNETMQTVVKRDPNMRDFYDTYDPLEVTVLDKKEYERYISSLTPEEKAILDADYNYYSIHFKNVGGMVMPLILQFKFTDGTFEDVRIPAEIWRRNNDEINKVFFFEKEVEEIVLDPYLETADTDRGNNYWPPHREPTRFELFKGGGRGGFGGGNRENPMQQSRKLEKMKENGNSGG
ncbi:MAG TPA: M1 family metallopeptidase, partial [Flavilitoribacter sp.]|nr:M1 family metallopeptidase [Flavilitoribacter sp.]